jgi:hypothetical protein
MYICHSYSLQYGLGVLKAFSTNRTRKEPSKTGVVNMLLYRLIGVKMRLEQTGRIAVSVCSPGSCLEQKC